MPSLGAANRYACSYKYLTSGSPLPGPFDPSSQDTAHRTHVDVVEASWGVIDIGIPKAEGRGLGPNFGFPDTSGLPTDPEPLRLWIQNHPLPGTGNRPGGKPPTATTGPINRSR